MIFRNNPIALVTAIALTTALTACSSSSSDEDTTKDVSIKFAAQLNGQNFICGVPNTGIGLGGKNYQVKDFRMYLYDMYIHDSTGKDHMVSLDQDGVWQLDNLSMLDFETGSPDCNGTPETNTVVKGKVSLPASVDLASTEVCFTVGVPYDKNHIDVATAASPLNASGMMWAWKVGRKYIRIDGVGDPAGTPQNFNIHLGAQGCPGSSATAPPDAECSYPNTVEVCVANFDVENSVIAVDPAPVLEANDVTVNLGAADGCQSFVSDGDCDEIMPRLGLDYSYGGTGNVSTYTAGQKMFSKQ